MVSDGGEAGRLLAGEGIIGVVADKSLLVEHGPVAAEEAVLGRAGHQPVVVLDRQADVEDLDRTGLNLFYQS